MPNTNEYPNQKKNPNHKTNHNPQKILILTLKKKKNEGQNASRQFDRWKLVFTMHASS